MTTPSPFAHFLSFSGEPAALRQRARLRSSRLRGEPGFHPGRAPVARARNRPQRDDLQHRQRAPFPAARGGAARGARISLFLVTEGSRALHHVLSRLSGLRATERCLLRPGRSFDDDGEPQPGGALRASLRRGGDEQLLRRARGRPRPRPHLSPGERPERRRSGDHHQLRVLAEALCGRSGGPRAERSSERDRLHDRGRRPRRVCGHRTQLLSRSLGACRPSGRHRAHGHQRCRGTSDRQLPARAAGSTISVRHRTPPLRCLPRRGASLRWLPSRSASPRPFPIRTTSGRWPFFPRARFAFTHSSMAPSLPSPLSFSVSWESFSSLPA